MRMNCWTFGAASKPWEQPQSPPRRAGPLMASGGRTLLLKMLVAVDGSVREQLPIPHPLPDHQLDAVAKESADDRGPQFYSSTKNLFH